MLMIFARPSSLCETLAVQLLVLIDASEKRIQQLWHSFNLELLCLFSSLKFIDLIVVFNKLRTWERQSFETPSCYRRVSPSRCQVCTSWRFTVADLDLTRTLHHKKTTANIYSCKNNQPFRISFIYYKKQSLGDLASNSLNTHGLKDGELRNRWCTPLAQEEICSLLSAWETCCGDIGSSSIWRKK